MNINNNDMKTIREKFNNKQNKCKNLGNSKLYTFCEINKTKTEKEKENKCKDESIIVKQEQIKRFTHKFAMQKLDFEQKIEEYEKNMKQLSQYCLGLEKDILQLQQQNRDIALERNDLYECLQYKKQQCCCEEYKNIILKRNEEVYELQNQITNLEEYIKNMETTKSQQSPNINTYTNTNTNTLQQEQLFKSNQILQIEYEHISQQLQIQRQMTQQLQQEIKQLKNQQTKIVQLSKKLTKCTEEKDTLRKQNKNIQYSLQTCRNIIYQLKRQLQATKEKVVEDWQIREIVMHYQAQLFQLTNHNTP